jgi:hypothetical protein
MRANFGFGALPLSRSSRTMLRFFSCKQSHAWPHASPRRRTPFEVHAEQSDRALVSGLPNRRNIKMRIKMLIAATGIAAFATPALADFYIVQDTSTKRCTIVEQRPTTQTSVIVGGDKVYTSRTEAEGALKTTKVCEGGGTVGGPAVPAPAPR